MITKAVKPACGWAIKGQVVRGPKQNKSYSQGSKLAVVNPAMEAADAATSSHTPHKTVARARIWLLILILSWHLYRAPQRTVVMADACFCMDATTLLQGGRLSPVDKQQA